MFRLIGLKHRLMARSRAKKYQELLSFLSLKKESLILDVGVNDQEFSPIDNYFEKNYPYPENITVLSIQELIQFPNRYPKIKAVYYEGGGRFPFEDKSFSSVISNAVIEHVGKKEDQVHFINEMIRVGEKIYFTTPAKEFPIEIHTNHPFVHWLPKHLFDRYISWAGKSWAAGDYMNLLSMKRLEQIISESNISHYEIIAHRIGPFPLHYAVVAT